MQLVHSAGLVENAPCPMTNVFDGPQPDDKERRAVEPERPIPEQRTRQIPQGSRDRENSRRISGAETRPPCAQNQRCNGSDMCATPPNSKYFLHLWGGEVWILGYKPPFLGLKQRHHEVLNLSSITFSPVARCVIRRQGDNATRCDDQGDFEPLQCGRISGEVTAMTLTALSCQCVNRTTGMMIPRTRTRVTNRDDVPDCERSSKYNLFWNCYYQNTWFTITLLSRLQELPCHAWRPNGWGRTWAIHPQTNGRKVPEVPV